MPVVSSFDPHCALVRTSVSGRVTADEIVRKKKAVEVAESAFAAEYLREVIDLTDVQSFALTTEDFRRLVDIDSLRAERARLLSIAFVAPHDLAYGIARMYCGIASRCDSIRGEVFRNSRAAFDFIELKGFPPEVAGGPDCIPLFRSC